MQQQTQMYVPNEDDLIVCPNCDCDLVLLTNKIMKVSTGLIGQPPQLAPLASGFMCSKCLHNWDGNGIKTKKDIVKITS